MKYIFIPVFCAVLLCSAVLLFVPVKDQKNLCRSPAKIAGYWLWAGRSLKTVPRTQNPELYLYQGLITPDKKEMRFTARGLAPHPIDWEGNIHLVFRLEGLKNTLPSFVPLLAQRIARWQDHGVSIKGIQIDYDSPSHQLSNYAAFLKKLRQSIPASYKLSITGLPDWLISSEQEVLIHLSKFIDYIGFQFYFEGMPLKVRRKHLERLKKTEIPFRLGFLQSAQHNVLPAPFCDFPTFQKRIIFVE